MIPKTPVSVPGMTCHRNLLAGGALVEIADIAGAAKDWGNESAMASSRNKDAVLHRRVQNGGESS
jgi:hypothetical protein